MCAVRPCSQAKRGDLRHPFRKGRVVIDGEDLSLTEGDWIRISPAAKRQFFASEDSAIRFICIQVKENSLEGFTMEDAIV